MAKVQRRFVCSKCGYTDKYYHVVCPKCGAEDSMIEIDNSEARKEGENSPSVFFLSEISHTQMTREHSPWQELDYILGGGIVKGSVILLAGPPGVGKSTLALTLTQVFNKPLYISGEENLVQVGLRARRLNLKNNIPFAFITTFDELKTVLSKRDVDFLVIDSLQVMRVGTNASFISHNEARLFMAELVKEVKKQNITTLVLGHITKEGSVAGPKTVEHLVDVVIYLNHAGRTGVRSLHVGKNRFGPSDGVIFMEMTSSGITPLSEKIILSEKGEIGRVYTVLVQGNVPNVVDVQVLITPSYTNIPRRIISGYPTDKFYLLLAVLEKKAGLKLYNKDVFVKVSGDYFWKDSALDLAIVAGVFSAYYNVPVPGNTFWMGIIDLLGNVKMPDNMDVRQRIVKTVGGNVINVANIVDLKKLMQRWR